MTRDLVTPVARWRADDIAQADNTSVGSWADAGGTYAASQGTTAAKPVVRTAGPNGHKYVYFNGQSDYLDTACPTPSSSAQTILAVVRPDDFSLSHRTVAGSIGDGGLELRFPSNAVGRRHLVKENVASIAYSGVSAISSPGAWTIIAATVTAGPSGTWAHYADGTPDDSGTHAQTFTSSRTLSIGANRAATANSFFAGAIADLLPFGTVLTTPQMAQWCSELQDTYGIAVANYVPDAPPSTPSPPGWSLEGGTAPTLRISRDVDLGPASGEWCWGGPPAEVTISGEPSHAWTPTGRHILVDGRWVNSSGRFVALDGRWVPVESLVTVTEPG